MKRPVIIFGAGVHLAGCVKEAIDYAHKTGIPVSPTWGGLDVLPHEDPLFIGSHGTHGTRPGNFALANADYIISIGSRLDTKTTGSPPKTFARDAKIVMVDIDPYEIKKFKHVDLKVEGINEDIRTFFKRPVEKGDYSEWLETIANWKKKYPICPPSYYKEKGANPYVLIKSLSNLCGPGDIICTDTGCVVAWTCQSFEFKKDQRLIHAWNQTPMGYGLPAAIGAHYATGKRVILLSGDGSFMMQNELATVAGHNLPIKIILLNNAGHAMCRQTQREWFDEKYDSTSIKGGLRFPPFAEVAEAHGIESTKIRKNVEIENALEQLLKGKGPKFLEVGINPNHDVIPKLFATKPIEDMQPYLSREEFKQQMIVEPM